MGEMFRHRGGGGGGTDIRDTNFGGGKESFFEFATYRQYELEDKNNRSERVWAKEKRRNALTECKERNAT